jgi:hypothetical protein
MLPVLGDEVVALLRPINRDETEGNKPTWRSGKLRGTDVSDADEIHRIGGSGSQEQKEIEV